MGSRVDEIRPKKVITFRAEEAMRALETMDEPVHDAIMRSRSMDAVIEYWKKHYVSKDSG